MLLSTFRPGPSPPAFPPHSPSLFLCEAYALSARKGRKEGGEFTCRQVQSPPFLLSLPPSLLCAEGRKRWGNCVHRRRRRKEKLAATVPLFSSISFALSSGWKRTRVFSTKKGVNRWMEETLSPFPRLSPFPEKENRRIVL